MTISPHNRKKFESMGADAVRLDLMRGFEGNERIPRGSERQEAFEWLVEDGGKQRRRETRHYWGIVVLTAIAAIAACIAAWPIVEGWLSRPIPPPKFTIVDPNGADLRGLPGPEGTYAPRSDPWLS